MKIGSLFSGGGLGDFGFVMAGMEIAWQCEIDEYCQKILALRYPESKKYRDIKALKGEELEPVDIIAGGFPCQPFSFAGKRKGADDNRYLWPEMLRIIKESQPRWVVGENVPGVINVALDTVCADLEAEGYEVWPIVFPSHALGAWHKRDRLWIMAYSERNGSHGSTFDRGIGEAIQEEPFWSDDPLDFEGASILPSTENIMANSLSTRLERQSRDGERGGEPRRQQEEQNGSISQSRLFDWRKYWQSEPDVGRVANGIAKRVDRLRMLGNGQTPCSTYVIGQAIMEIESYAVGEF